MRQRGRRLTGGQVLLLLVLNLIAIIGALGAKRRGQ